MADKLITKNWGKDSFDFRTKKFVGKVAQVRFDELHLKEDGTVDNKPSFCAVLTVPRLGFLLAQISERMLKEGLEELGYKLERIKQ